jgi:maltose O-acetyltransferase
VGGGLRRVLGKGRLAREARLLRSRVRGDPDLDALRRQGLDAGDWVYAGRWTLIDPGFCWLISIGDATVISARVTILAHDASTRNHMGYTRIARVRIGRNVFIGTHSVILPGTTIGDDAIIGAGSIVRGEVPAGTVWAGNPARQIATTDEYIGRHSAVLAGRPHYPFDGYTVEGGITDERKREMRDALADGPGYVQ